MESPNTLIEQARQFVEDVGLARLLLLFGTFFSLNFYVYIISFDKDLIVFADAPLVAKHILNISLLYAFSYVVAFFTFVACNKIMSSSVAPLFGFVDKVSEKIGSIILKRASPLRNADESVKSGVLGLAYRHSLAFVLFCAGYVGIVHTVVLGVIVIVFSIFLIFVEKLLKTKLLKTAEQKTEDEYTENNQKAVNSRRCKSQPSISKFFMSNFTIMLLVVSVLLGLFRAVYVRETVQVNLNKSAKKTYSLFMSTNAGIGLIEQYTDKIYFVSWEHVKELDFVQDKKQQNFFYIPWKYRSFFD